MTRITICDISLTHPVADLLSAVSRHPRSDQSGVVTPDRGSNRPVRIRPLPLPSQEYGEPYFCRPGLSNGG
ncbi:hypothetical protein GWI33_018432 [Rhynchophorus ferrugineus]|uniref:Uncharacterized protein n=1 Tax=Rhynchophorus ferrugineus TaxID=354439 RepID=A0A834I7B7_RHYFE|nr:hypothetical protein GWI33_018432 [Rhynchophorus ferrugineus]